MKKKLRNISLKVEESPFEQIKINSSRDTAALIRKFYLDDIVLFESFFLLTLDRFNQTLSYAKISQGGVAGTYVDSKIIMKYAVEDLASSVIIAHNHPSGNKQPSPQDRQITSRLKEGLKLLDITLLDHIIITKESYFSFADEDLL